MIPPTSPGADSTPVERRTLVERLRHIVGVERHAETLGCPMILLPASADAVEAAATEIEALLAALLRSQQEREALATALRRLAYPSGEPFSEPGRVHTCPVCRAHEMWPHDDGARAHFADCWLGRALHPHPETPSHE